MICPRCNQPMSERVRRHKDGSRDLVHTCKRHIVWQTLRERRDATDAQVRVMRRTDPWAEAPDHKVVPRFEPTKPPGIVLPLPELAFELPGLPDMHGTPAMPFRDPIGRDFKDSHDIMRWLERNTGLCCNVWLDDDKLTVHVYPLADYYPHQQRAATEMLRDALPIHVALNWHWRGPKEEPPPRPLELGELVITKYGGSAHVAKIGACGVHLLFGNTCYAYTWAGIREGGWTHADGTAIAVETLPKRREPKLSDVVLGACPGEQSRDWVLRPSWRAEWYAVHGNTHGVHIDTEQMRLLGWTFADTGEAV